MGGGQECEKKWGLKGGLNKTMGLREEMQERQEWISQAEEDYLERDFTYHPPEGIRRAVEEVNKLLVPAVSHPPPSPGHFLSLVSLDVDFLFDPLHG